MGECSDQRRLRELTARFGKPIRRTNKGIMFCLGCDPDGRPVHVTIADPNKRVHDARSWKNSLAAFRRAMRQAVRFL